MDSKLLHSIVEQTPDPIIIQTAGKFAWMNPAACHLFGMKSADELKDTDVIDRFHPDCRERFQMINDEVKPLQPLQEYQIIRPDGSMTWVQGKGNAITYEGKKGSLIFLRDISGLKKTEKALHDSEERIQFALETNDIGIMDLDLTDNTASRTLTHDNIFGYPRLLSSWSYQTFLRHVHPDDRRFVQDKFKCARETCRDINFECRIFRSDGQLRWIWISGKYTASDSGDPLRMVGVVQDITTRKIAEATLKSSYALLRIAGEIAHFGGWSINIGDTAGDLVNSTINWSPAVADIHETPPLYAPLVKDAIGFYTPRWRERVTRVLNDCAEKGISFDEEMEIISTSGKQIWIRNTGEAVRENGKIVKVQGALQDITKIKKAEHELKVSEEKFRNAFHNHSAAKLMIDPVSGAITEANKAAARLYGWTIEELRRMNISEINVLPGQKQNRQTDRLRDSENKYFDFRHRKSDGTIRDVEMFTSKIEIGGKAYLHSIIHDVSEKKRVEKQFNLLSHSVEQSPVGIVITDSDGNIQYVNPGFEKTTGYSFGEIEGKNPRILKSGYHSNELYTDLWNTILSGRDWTGELKNKTKNGELYWEKLVISPILNTDGEISNFVSIRENVTERKKMVEDLVTAKEKAEESDRLKSAFLANISHEIRTPMNGIMGFAEILKQPGLTSQKKLKFLDIIENSGKRMLDTVNDLIDISRIETGQVQLHISEVDLKEQLDNLFEFFLPQAAQKGLVFTMPELSPAIPDVIKTDRSKLDSILTNLIKNAIKFTDNGKIEVGCNLKDHFLEFFVKDTGIGVPRNRQEDIFNRFVQADAEDVKAFQGSGLGLSISRAYAELLGGDIWVESQEGNGSTFYFTILLTGNKTHAGGRNRRKRIQNKGIPDLKGKKILVAEDDLYCMEMIVYLLKKTGAKVLKAKDGRESVEEFKNGSVDLVLLDIQMPELNGYEVLYKIRLVNPEIPVIAQTAYVMADDIKKFKETGFTDYLTKPIGQDKLYNLLNKYLKPACI
jgi:PAS domain S-box-containing protein